MRGTLIWLGYADPADSIEAVRAEDPRRAELAAVTAQWDVVLGDRRVSSAEIIAAAAGTAEFREALLAVAGAAGAINTRRLGNWLAGVKGKLVDGLKLEPAGVRQGNRLWALHGGRAMGSASGGGRDEMDELLR